MIPEARTGSFVAAPGSTSPGFAGRRTETGSTPAPATSSAGSGLPFSQVNRVSSMSKQVSVPRGIERSSRTEGVAEQPGVGCCGSMEWGARPRRLKERFFSKKMKGIHFIISKCLYSAMDKGSAFDSSFLLRCGRGL